MTRPDATAHTLPWPRPLTRENSRVNGRRPSADVWASLVWESKRCRVDPGPSPAGNVGPYLHVPQSAAWDDALARVYPEPRWLGKVQPIRIAGGVWAWERLPTAGRARLARAT